MTTDGIRTHARNNQSRGGTGQDFFDPTRLVNLKIYAGRPAGVLVSDRPGRAVFLQKVFFHCSMHLMKSFRKARGIGEVLKFVTPDGGLRKKNASNFLRILQK